MSSDLYFGFIALASVICFLDWRKGLYLCLLIDVARDPIRKLIENEPVLITVTGVIPWAAIFMGAAVTDRARLKSLWKNYPKMQVAITCILAAVLPAALISSITYGNGWLLALIGSGSYLAPLFGIVVGFALARSENDVYSFLRFYSVVNSIVLVGVLLEYFGSTVPGLGGIKVDWVRYREGYVVNLISGFYRSPDIMGLHAAHVVLFSSVLALRAKNPLSRAAYIGLIFWGTIGLLLCGRRKMIGMPVVYMIASFLISRWRGVPRMGAKVAGPVLLVIVAGVAFVTLEGEHVEGESGGGEEYTEYAMTMFTEGHERARDNVLGGTIMTLQQVGVLGAGLGTATQGKYYITVTGLRKSGSGWQEDGVSRLFMELGVPGVLLILFAGAQLVIVLRQAVMLVPPNHSAQLMQIGLLATISADTCSYIFSHQQYSGDPVSALLVTVMMGAVMGAPGIFAADLSKLRAAREAAARAANRLQSSGAQPPQTGGVRAV
jgi:hypothetical protein